MSKVTIAMYHYVRELKHSRYPEIKGLDTALFKAQIEYLQKRYNFITMETLIDSIENRTELPPKAVMLTFDDAYIDHYTSVFPILNEKNIQGSFFIPTKAVTENSLLDVNKIHFILASEPDASKLISEIYRQLDMYRAEYNLNSNEHYFETLAKPSRFDTADVVFIKRLLQTELPLTVRTIIAGNLFKKFVTADEPSFSRELYMSVDQIKCMHRCGMHIGSHGYDHLRLGTLSKEAQSHEIEKGRNFLLSAVGVNLQNLTMCYPYGNYNRDTAELLSGHKFKLALTTDVAVADLNKHDRFALPRLNTNDLPKDSTADVNTWFYDG